MARGQVSAGPTNPRGAKRADQPEEIPRDRWDRPLLAPAGTTRPPSTLARKDLVAHTRASTLGNAVEDQVGLGIWKMRMAVFGMARRRDLVLLAASVPTPDDPGDKTRLGKIADDALEAAEASAKATIGTALHGLTERIDAGEKIPDIGEDRRVLDAYSAKMAAFTIHGSEVFVVNDSCGSAGTFDRLVRPRVPMRAPDGTVIGPDDLVIVDIKTSGSSDYFGPKFAIQLAVYGGGVPYTHAAGRLDWATVSGRDGPASAPRTDWALILHMPSGGELAEWYWVDLTQGAALIECALAVRDWRRNESLVIPADDPVLPADDGGITAQALLHLIDEALSEETLTGLWRTHREHWAPEHTERVRARLAELAA